MTSSNRKIKPEFYIEVLVPVDIESTWMSEESQKQVALELATATIFKENKGNYKLLDNQLISEPCGNTVSIVFMVWYIVHFEHDLKELENLFREKYITPIPSEWKAKFRLIKSDFL